MEHAYAQALWNMIEGGMTHKKAVQLVRDQLAAHGRTELLRRVGHAFEKIAARESGKNEITLTIAREKDERHAKSEAKEVLAELELETRGVETRIDDTLIGGWRLEGGGILIDASHKKHLLTLYNRTTK